MGAYYTFAFDAHAVYAVVSDLTNKMHHPETASQKQDLGAPFSSVQFIVLRSAVRERACFWLCSPCEPVFRYDGPRDGFSDGCVRDCRRAWDLSPRGDDQVILVDPYSTGRDTDAISGRILHRIMQI